MEDRTKTGLFSQPRKTPNFRVVLSGPATKRLDPGPVTTDDHRLLRSLGRTYTYPHLLPCF